MLLKTTYSENPRSNRKMKPLEVDDAVEKLENPCANWNGKPPVDNDAVENSRFLERPEDSEERAQSSVSEERARSC